MQVSYGSPGHRGVTDLMAVGADDLEETSADRAARNMTMLGVAVALVGVLVGSKAAKYAGAGAAVAGLAVRRSTRTRLVPVTTSAPFD
jgi:hypothetical protein